MLDTWIIRNLIRVPLGTRALEEGAVVMDGECHHNPEKKEPTRGNSEPEKKRRCKHSPRKGRKGDIPLGYSGRRALRREQCNRFAQSVAK
jgi:hypothetical protein